MRKGKMVAQGAHASMKAIFDKMNMHPTESSGKFGTIHEKTLWLEDNTALMDWVDGIFTKVCVSVDSEQELLDVYNKAKEAGILCALIQDAGLTEFGGVPTYTCCAIGPEWSDQIDSITGNLKLL
jgi:PTH2 family peptidyl-tRNA hydrolase